MATEEPLQEHSKGWDDAYWYPYSRSWDDYGWPESGWYNTVREKRKKRRNRNTNK